MLSMDFALLPPYFDFSDIEDGISKVAEKRRIEIWLDASLLKTDDMTVQVKYLAWILFSNIFFIMII